MKPSTICAAVLLLGMSSMTPAADEPGAAGKQEVRTGPSIELVDLITRVAKRTGKQFILDPRVSATVSTAGFDVNRVDYPRLLAILRVNQLAAYEATGVVNVLPDANARQFAVPVSTEIGPQVLDDEMVTLVVQAKHVCAAQTVPVLRPLMPQAAHLAAFPQSNSLIISDRAGNARKLVALLELLDKQAGDLGRNCESGEKSN